MSEVRVGLGVIVLKDEKFLVGKRKGSHVSGVYSFPGGHLDFNETWENCALRELREECGESLSVKFRKYTDKRTDWFVSNDILKDCNKHYITIFLVCDWISGDPVNEEPEKCEGWEWVNFDILKNMALKNECASWIPIDFIENNRKFLGV